MSGTVSSGGEVAAWAVAGTGLLAMLGGAVRWMVTWLSGRNDKHVTELIAEVRAQRKEIEEPTPR